ncbi:MAG: hypothetical protein HRT70_07225 [Flavobacteriaceae bacterium]|nr:hypothetical protein [Flavobacteriaceae bacterium]
MLTFDVHFLNTLHEAGDAKQRVDQILDGKKHSDLIKKDEDPKKLTRTVLLDCLFHLHDALSSLLIVADGVKPLISSMGNHNFVDKQELKELLSEVLPDIVTQSINESGVLDKVGRDFETAKDAFHESRKFLSELSKSTTEIKSYADVVKKHGCASANMPNNIVDATTLQTIRKTSEEAMKHGLSSFLDKENRASNIVISGMSANNDQDLMDEVCQLISYCLKCTFQPKDIVSINKIGRQEVGDRSWPRLTLVSLRYKADAVLLHNNGKGFMVNRSTWINPDLTKAERDDLYKTRLARRANKSRSTGSITASEGKQHGDDQTRTLNDVSKNCQSPKGAMVSCS